MSMLASKARMVLRRTSTTTTATATRRVAVQQRQQRQPVGVKRNMGSDATTPVPQSQNAELWSGHTVKKEGWEEYIYFYYTVGLLLQAAVVFGAPETSIESWARPEAKARLYLASEEAGDLQVKEFVFGQHYQGLMKKEQTELWSKFTDRAINPGDDDDDDDDDVDDDDDEVCFYLLIFLLLLLFCFTLLKLQIIKFANSGCRNFFSLEKQLITILFCWLYVSFF
jgi:hypothetical protein